MSVKRQLFWSLTVFISAMAIAFVLVTIFVVKPTIEHIRVADRSREIEEISKVIVDHYEKKETLEGIQLKLQSMPLPRPDSSVILMTTKKETLFAKGAASHEMVKMLGIKKRIQSKNEDIAVLYYSDSEVANLSTIQMGIGSSVTVLLLGSSAILLLLSLVAAYWLAKRLTRPLTDIIPVIDRLRKGDFTAEAPVHSNNEYGKIAKSLNAMTRQLVQAEDVRRKLVADVAHELRTPITILRGKFDLFQHEGLPIAPENMLPIQDELIRLTRLVDDLHQLSLAEARKLQLDLKPTDLPDLLGRVIERLQHDAEAKDISISFTKESNLPPIRIDQHRMIQVFMNLIGNAVRYTPAGGSVSIAVKLPPPNDSGPLVLQIEVADTGQGIAPEHIPFVFNRFYRTDEARNRNNGGMGLGLAIAREFVLAHQGEIKVQTEVGRGSVFTVFLPLLP
ncbi:ATP-binding protein [Paenibacillus allorhizosphaerae]|uniref:histidine kinase n=1 Tax=Paenibacillus allorhizosphaerae TaxID=2849866 RepID=A0ABN7U153_9BACL|nr:ATP-binding protein [Paenibacillus allorhizosphaerae]CAG7658719.1 Adaptive-response sensory-kinase SasA [Paenibacillus allorhizosphaerae]